MSLSRSSPSRAPLRMYHCRVETISSGRSPFSKNFTAWLNGLPTAVMSPVACSFSTIALRALKTVLPAISSPYQVAASGFATEAGASGRNRPSRPIVVMFGSDSLSVVRSSRHQMMSVTSPKVQTMAAPVPLSGWARWCPWISISAPKKGVFTLVPMRCLCGPSGCVTIAMHAGSSSGRVVSIAIDPEPSAKGNSIV